MLIKLVISHDILTRGFNEQSVSYQRRYYTQNGHQRLKAAKDLGLQTIKVNQIIPYSESVKLGITNLPNQSNS